MHSFPKGMDIQHMLYSKELDAEAGMRTKVLSISQLLEGLAKMRNDLTLLTPFLLKAMFHYFSESRPLSSQGYFIHSYTFILFP